MAEQARRTDGTLSERVLDRRIADEWQKVRALIRDRQFSAARNHQFLAVDLMRRRTPEHVARLERERGLAA